MRFRPLAFFLTLLIPSLRGAAPVAEPAELLYRADFSKPLSEAWVVEQQPGGTVTTENGTLLIDDQAGCTVWLKQPFEAPVIIKFKAEIESAGRVSDLNCFWMATDPANLPDLFHADHTRDGRFFTYDPLQLYYVGYGGNENSTTRFRRYAGTGARPLDPAHDLSAPEFMLRGDHVYEVTLIAAAGRAQYWRDGELIFDFADPKPLTRGWFGFRTVKSRYRVHSLEVWSAQPAQ